MVHCPAFHYGILSGRELCIQRRSANDYTYGSIVNVVSPVRLMFTTTIPGSPIVQLITRAS